MTLNDDRHNPLFPNLLLTIAGGMEYLKLKRASRNPTRTQATTLRSIIEYGKDTVFGKEHRFSYILDATNDEELFRRYREFVPLMEYEDYRPYVNRMKDGESDVLFQGRPILYATTSGTTGEPKWIPISQKYLDRVYGKMNKAWMYFFYRNRPKVFTGYVVSIVGKQIEGYTPDGTIYGSVSGFTQARCPGLIRRMYVSPNDIYRIEDYTARNYAIMRMGIERNVTLVVTANPSTMIEMQHNVDRWWEEYITDIGQGTMSEKVDIPTDIREALRPYLKPNPERAAELRRLKETYGQVLPKHFWPNLQVLSTWKCGNTRIYLDGLAGAYPESMLHQEFAYFSSECRAGLVLDDSLETALFSHMHYFEFRKAEDFDNPDARIYQLSELVEGEKYCPLVTTFSGLYRYNMNDIVEVGSPFMNTPRIHMVQKVNGIVSITGEKLYEGQFISAVNLAVKATGRQLAYFVGYANLENSRYDLYFEFADQATTQQEADDFGSIVDENIKSLNIEYASKRDSFRLGQPVSFRLGTNSFDAFKQEYLQVTHADASRFKPNILAQDDVKHGIISRFILS